MELSIKPLGVHLQGSLWQSYHIIYCNSQWEFPIVTRLSFKFHISRSLIIRLGAGNPNAYLISNTTHHKMHSFSTFFLALVAVSTCVDGVVISGPRYNKVLHSPRNCPNVTASAKALYFITNDANNSVVAIPINKNGTLSDGSFTATGGAGSNEVDATGKPLAPDALSSQGSVRVAGKVSPIHTVPLK